MAEWMSKEVKKKIFSFSTYNEFNPQRKLHVTTFLILACINYHSPVVENLNNKVRVSLKWYSLTGGKQSKWAKNKQTKPIQFL